MIYMGSVADARANRNYRVLPNGAGFWRSELVTVEGGPQAFLVEQDPHSVVLPHFHFEDEFQVVIGGSGLLGRHALHPGFVHYAAKHTGYGPLTAGADGLAYLTLRAVLDLGAHFLPEERQRMQPALRRNLFGSGAHLQHAGKDAIHRLHTRSVVPPQADGVAAWLLDVAPKTPVELPPPTGGDRFMLVTTGALSIGGTLAASLSTIFVPQDERDFDLGAGDQGVALLVVQFARANVAAASHADRC